MHGPGIDPTVEHHIDGPVQPTRGRWYRIFRTAYVRDESYDLPVEGALDEFDDDGIHCWLVDREGNDVYARIDELEAV